MKTLNLPRVFEELNPEVDKTAQLFAQGYEHKEIMEIKCRAYGTILNQVYNAMRVLDVNNRSELSLFYCVFS